MLSLLLWAACTGGGPSRPTSALITDTSPSTDTAALTDSGLVEPTDFGVNADREIAACFASAGLDSSCDEGEVSWAAVGPFGCVAHSVTVTSTELQYDVDGDIRRVRFAPDDAVEVIIHTFSSRGAPYGSAFIGGVDLLGWQGAAATLVAVDYPDGYPQYYLPPEAPTFRYAFFWSGGELDQGTGPVALPADARGAGCANAPLTLAGFFP